MNCRGKVTEFRWKRRNFCTSASRGSSEPVECGGCTYKKCETFPLIASNLVYKHVLVTKFVLCIGPFFRTDLSKYSF